MKNSSYIFLFTLYISLQASAQQEIIPFDKAYKRTYDIRKSTAAPPSIDGRMDEAFWEQTPWSEPFVQVMPDERVPSPSVTRMKLLYDNTYIYAGIYCKDAEPEKMNRFINNRDANSIGDLVSIAFDTYHDFRAAPEFNLNLGGNKTDLVVNDKRVATLSWNAVWDARTHIDLADSAWTAEMRIPFSQLRYNRRSSDGVWGLHIRRIIRHRNEVQNWSLIPLKNNGHVFSFGEMRGMTDLPKPRGIEILPYVMGKYSRRPEVAGSPYGGKNNSLANAGLDARFALSDYTLDLTVNPDFGQVELDPSVMNLTAYETFYDEMRPFFLEGKHIFDFASGSDMMFYSRRIGSAPGYAPEGIDNVNSFAEAKDNVPIIGALKLTGSNRNGLTIGIMQNLTAASYARVSRNGTENEEAVEPATNYTIARVQKNSKGNTFLGAMFTSVNRMMNHANLENLMPRNAYAAGIDFVQYFKNRLYYIDMKGMFSSINGTKAAIMQLQTNAVHYYQRPDAGYIRLDSERTGLNGTGGYVKAGRRGNAKWAFSETFEWASPGFDMNDAGYLKQADMQSNSTAIEFRQTDTWRTFRSNQFILTQKNVWNYGGTPVNNSLSLEWKTMTLSRYELTLNETFGWNQLDSRLLRGGPDMRHDPWFNTAATFNTDKARRVIFTGKYTGTRHIGGHRNYNAISPALSFRLAHFILLSAQFDYAWNNDDMQYVGKATPQSMSGAGYSPAYVLGEMEQHTYGATVKLQANITPDVSIQLYGSPFTSVARYDNYKLATNTVSERYEERSRPLLLSGDSFSFIQDDLRQTFSNPNFRFNEFRSNIVGRWEFRPGSTLYIVWEHRRSRRDGGLHGSWGENLERMSELPSTNTLMIKINYWINL
jgi:hypothetical protein